MTRVSLGDASLANMLARQGTELRGQVQRATQEVTTGRHADLGKALRGDFSPLLAIDASIARLGAFGRAATDAGTQTAAQQAAMAGLSSLATGITPMLIGMRDFQTAVQASTLGAQARGRLESAIGLLNTQAAGRAVFSGVETGTMPLGPADDMLAALETAAAGATTGGQVAAAVLDWFDDPSGFGAFYRGGSPLPAVAVAPGQMVGPGTTAMDPVLRKTLAGFAMAALLDRGVLASMHEERARLAVIAGETLLAGEDGRIALAARIGIAEAQIEAARTRNAAETTALGILRSEIASVDQYDAATRLEAARTQLEALYLLTARVSRLSLTEFLR